MTAVAGSERALLEERARALARPLEPERHGAELSLVTFGLADEVYGIEARYVCGVFRLVDLAPLPGADGEVAGFTTWRGDLLRVLDVRVLLGLPAAGLDDRVWIVAVGATRPSVGLLAGTVRDLVIVREADVHAPPKQDRRLVRGVTHDAVLVIDVDSILEASG